MIKYEKTGKGDIRKLMFESLLTLDGNILLWIQEYIRNDVLTPIMRFITTLGDAGAIWIVLALVLLCFKKTRKIGLLVGASLIGSLLVNNIVLKNLIGRIRPYEVISELQILIDKPLEYSFPSGHTGSSFAAGVTLFLCCPKKYGVPALVLAFLIAVSRLYVGVHYPTDVLGGMLTGTLIALFVCKNKFVKNCGNAKC